METNCYPAHARRVGVFLVLAVITVFMATIRGNMEEATAAGAPDGSLLCISRCGACPATCAQSSPPPPSAPQTPSMLPSPPPPSKTHSSPPPPSKTHSSPPSPPAHAPPPPPTQGTPSNPYYYFYTSEARGQHSVPGFLRLFPSILFLFLSMLLRR